MTIHSILLIQKLLSTNAHLGRRVAAHHFKVYICGSRNGIAILDSDKTLICLRNTCNFIGFIIRQKGRFFFVNTNSLFDEIIEQMATRIGCINDSQWRIGGFLTNCSSPKKIRSRNKKINFGSNQQPDCVIIFDADRKSSVILEADRLQIPIVSLVDSNIPLVSYKIITYPIPANDSIQFVYLFCNLITKTVLLERGRIVAIRETVGATRSTHIPKLLHFYVGGFTHERKMERVPHPFKGAEFLATNPFSSPFIRVFRATPSRKPNFYRKRKAIPFLLVVTLVVTFIIFYYIICDPVGLLSFFRVFLERLAFSLGGRGLSFILYKLGCSGRLALLGTLGGFAGKAIFGFFAGEADLSMYMSPREASPGASFALPSSSIESVPQDDIWRDLEQQPPGTSSTSGSGNWRQYLNPSSDNEGNSSAAPSTDRTPGHLPQGGGELEAPALNQPDEGDRGKAAREQRQLDRAVARKLKKIRDFAGVAQRVLQENNIPGSDKIGIMPGFSEFFLAGKSSEQIARAIRALGNPNSQTVANLLAEFDAFENPEP